MPQLEDHKARLASLFAPVVGSTDLAPFPVSGEEGTTTGGLTALGGDPDEQTPVLTFLGTIPGLRLR